MEDARRKNVQGCAPFLDFLAHLILFLDMLSEMSVLCCAGEIFSPRDFLIGEKCDRMS